MRIKKIHITGVKPLKLTEMPEPKLEKTAKQIKQIEELSKGVFDKKKQYAQKTAFPIVQTLKSITTNPMPGRYYIRFTSDEYMLMRSDLSTIVNPKNAGEWSYEEMEQKLYDDPRDVIVLAKGKPFKKPDGSFEDMPADVGDRIIVSFNRNRLFPHIIYKGYILFIITNADILGIIEKNADLRLLEDTKK